MKKKAKINMGEIKAQQKLSKLPSYAKDNARVENLLITIELLCKSIECVHNGENWTTYKLAQNTLKQYGRNK